MKEIAVEQKVVEYIVDQGTDFRLSTSCYGPVIVPLKIKPPKETDLQIEVGENTLYVSRVQARYIDRITHNMICDTAYLRSCSVLRE